MMAGGSVATGGSAATADVGSKVTASSRTTARARLLMGGILGPELALEPVLGLVDGALVGAGREVLPATVAHDERDVGAFPRLGRLGGLAQRGVQDRAGRDAGEDAF